MTTVGPLTDEQIRHVDVLLGEERYNHLAYRFVNLALLSFFSERLRQIISEDRESPTSGTDFVQCFRTSGGEIFGMLAPLVFKNWGLKTDHDIYRILVALKSFWFAEETEMSVQLTDERCFTGNTIMTAIEPDFTMECR